MLKRLFEAFPETQSALQDWLSSMDGAKDIKMNRVKPDNNDDTK